MLAIGLKLLSTWDRPNGFYFHVCIFECFCSFNLHAELVWNLQCAKSKSNIVGQRMAERLVLWNSYLYFYWYLFGIRKSNISGQRTVEGLTVGNLGRINSTRRLKTQLARRLFQYTKVYQKSTQPHLLWKGFVVQGDFFLNLCSVLLAIQSNPFFWLFLISNPHLESGFQTHPPNDTALSCLSPPNPLNPIPPNPTSDMIFVKKITRPAFWSH